MLTNQGTYLISIFLTFERSKADNCYLLLQFEQTLSI